MKTLFPFRIIIPVILAGCLVGCSAKDPVATWKEGFEDPPVEAKPQVWWHWMNGNITKDGIRKDLEWMKRAGLGGFHHFDAALSTPQIVEKRLIYMQPDWKDAFNYTIHLADSLGLEATIASSPGWSHTGGPWVEPKDAMKKIVWRSVVVDAGSEGLSLRLPQPFENSGAFQNGGGTLEMVESSNGPKETLYEDIAILAVRLPEGEFPMADYHPEIVGPAKGTVSSLTDEDLLTGCKIESRNGVATLEYRFPSLFTFTSLRLGDNGGRGTTILEKSLDGKEYTPVATVPSSSVSQITMTFPPSTGRYFRLSVQDQPVNPIMAAVGLGGGLKGATITEFELYNKARINNSEAKAGFIASPDLIMDKTLDYGDDRAAEVVDVSEYVKDGVLEWKAVEGKWRIYRIGYSLTGKMNHPAPAEATGLEVDKLDPKAWRNYIGTYLDMIGEAGGGIDKIDYLLTDSYEAGCANWTPDLIPVFLRRRGYDPLPFLPVLAGEIIESVERSEEFLYDYRRTLGELLSENYNSLEGIVRARGMKGVYSESHENGRAMVADGMDVKKGATVPMSAIWMPGPMSGSTLTQAIADMKESSSVAHIYGQKAVAAESMTSVGLFGLAYSYCPENLKGTVDNEFASGVNRIVVHESAHQPLDEKFPGLGLSVTGQWFNRHETWAELASAWTGYIARSSYLLQRGHDVSDILIYYGEDTNITAKYGTTPPNIPAGYNFDYINSSTLMDMLSFRKGSFSCGGDGSWKVLLIDAEFLREDVSDKIESLRQEGAPVYDIKDAETALSNIEKDIISSDPRIRFVHRSDLGGDIYWIDNPTEEYLSTTLSLRSEGVPSIWNPVTGKISSIPYEKKDGRMHLSLDLDSEDALFIILGKHPMKGIEPLDRGLPTSSSDVEGPWQVSFQEGRGAPEGVLVWNDLSPLNESEVDGIRYFSGTATYRTTIKISSGEKRTVLDLGKVKNLAEVLLNGKEVAILWKAPFRTDITAYLDEGDNTLEIKVTNLWPNRLIGDSRPGVSPITYTAYPFYSPGDALLESGLIGPVKILR